MINPKTTYHAQTHLIPKYEHAAAIEIKRDELRLERTSENLRRKVVKSLNGGYAH